MTGGTRSGSVIDRNRSGLASFKRRRAALLALSSAAAVVALVDSPSALGTAITFTATAANAAWTTASNWSPAQVPGINDDIIVPAGGNQMGCTVATFTIKTFTFNGSTNRAVADQSTAATNTAIVFNGSGANPLINVTNLGGFTFQGPNGSSGTGTLGIVLNASGDFNVSNATLTVSSDIAESGNSRALTINANGGAGTVILGGNNSFSGGITLFGGDLQLNSVGSTYTTVPNKIVFGGGARMTLNVNQPAIGGLSASSNAAIVDALGANTLVVAQSDDEVFSGALQDGAGVLGLTKTGPGKLTLNGGQNPFSGQIAVTGGTLFADHSHNTERKLGIGTAALAMYGGTIGMNGDNDSPGPDDVESFSTTTLNSGLAIVQVIPGANRTSMQLGSITHGTTATANFEINGFGPGEITTSSANDSTGILGPWATYGANDWATVNGSGQIVAFTGYAAKDDPSTWVSTDHVTYGSTTGHVTTPTSITTLRFDATGTQPALAIDAGNTLTINSGGLFVDFHAGFGTISGAGALTSGTSTLFVHTNGGVAISAPITNNTSGAVTVVSSGSYLAPTATNTYTGDTVINGGSILLTGDMVNAPTFLTNKGVAGPLGAGNNIVLNGGTLVLQGAFAPAQSTDRDIQISGVTGISIGGTSTLSGVISDPGVKGTLNVDGLGSLILTGVNTYQGGTVINSGFLTLTTRDSLGNAAGSVLLNGGTLNIAGTFGFSAGRTLVSKLSTLPINVVGTSTGTLGGGGSAAKILVNGTLLKSGTGTFALGLGILNTANKLLVTGGDLAYAGDAQLGLVPTTLIPDAVELQGGTLRLYSSSALGLTLNSNRGVTVDSFGGGTLDFSPSSGTPFLSYPITGAGRLYKNGPATVSSNVSHSFSGGFDIVEGRWNVTTAGAAGTGSIIMEGGSPGASPRDGNGSILAIAQLGIGSSNLAATVTLPNDILLAPVGSGTNSFEVNTTDNLVLNGVISGTGGIGKGQVAATTGTLTLGGSNTYSGPTNIALGTLALGANEVIPDSSAVTIATGAAMFMNGRTETIGSLLGGGTVDTGTGGALSVGADNTAATYSGALQGSGSVTKIGTGTQTFSGTNTYTGLTTVKAGNLTLTGAPAQSRVLAGGGADIQGGRVVFSDNSSAATMKGLLKSSFQNNGFNNTNQIRSTTADSRRGLGYLDDGTHFTVAYTYYGDTNLSGTVDTSDFTTLGQHFANTNLATAGSPTWSEGDFNYDGVINALDFNAIATNFGAVQLPSPSLGTLVPEPASIAAVCAGVALLKRRSRRA